MNDDLRPSPDALLEAAQREEKQPAQLKIFLGAAPGVGKTYAMLQAAHAKLREGVDVVAGVVETHGRAETQALLDGLEVIARRLTDYKGHVIEEMDLDAILERRPRLVLVDELAHTNAPGSRHPKRYNDVEELIAAGIDVYSTLNIQHVESLNNVIAQITRIRVRETVPDSILDNAGDIEAIDIAPGDLIQRLREGKVYLPRQAERALKNFFSAGNLTALRELTLRRTAQRVDEQLLTHMQTHAIRGPWAAGERLLVCVSEDPRSQALVRYAKRAADQLHASWTALYIETPRSLRFSEEKHDNVASVLRLAERLGADPVTIPSGGRYIADDILTYAQTNNFTQIVVGKTRRSRWFELMNGSVVHELVRHSGNIGVHVVAGDEPENMSARGKPERLPAPRKIKASPYLIALAMIACALGMAKILEPFIGVNNIDLFFITAVVGVAVTFGLWPSLLAVGVATLSYNFFFLPPLYTFTIADPANVATLLLFTLVAVLVSNLAARTRRQATVAQSRARITEALYSFSRKLGSCVNADDVLWATAHQIASMLHVRVVMLLPENGTLQLKAGYPPEDLLEDSDLAAAQWAWTNNRPAGRGADTLPGGKRLFAPMRTGRGPVGVVGIDDDKTGMLLTPEQHRLLDALLDQGALAIERVHLAEDVDRAKLTAETDRLRTSLLTSISHDLKTPLAAILGAGSTLRDYDKELSDEGKTELLSTVITESERLNRFIANLLDMTKLESGAISPNFALHDMSELVGAALQRANRILAGHKVEVSLAGDLPMLRVDAVLFDQVLFNLLDNASKYASGQTTIHLRTWCEGAWVTLQIIDEGEGIPEDDVENIFEKFFRARKGDRVLAGTGLGLAIARGFVESMGGTISASNRQDRAGAIFTMKLPVPAHENTLDTAA